jgi:hypothetical protein
MPFAALVYLFTIINLGSIVRLIRYALLGTPKIKHRLWQVVIYYISYLALLAIIDIVNSTYRSYCFYYFN